METVKIIQVVKGGKNEGEFLLRAVNNKGKWTTLMSSSDYNVVYTEYLRRINPIIDGRIVNDNTFAIRFKNFLKGIQVCDAASDEELNYFKGIAAKLLDFQVETATTPEEIAYLKNVELL